MQPLATALQTKHHSLDEFADIAIRVLDYLPNVLTGHKEKYPYRLSTAHAAGTTKYIRPINTTLFLGDKEHLVDNYGQVKTLIASLHRHRGPLNAKERELIDKTLYTIQQSIGAGLDLLVGSNSARKHVGNRFEELVRAVFVEMGVANKRTVLQIPYESDEGIKIYKCENDLILSGHKQVKSTNTSLDDSELVVSVKTTSKDRMGKMFIDKLLLERFVQHPQKVIGIFLNDVQRKSSDNISYTLVSGLFMVYTKFLIELEGIYYLDPPPNALKEPYKKHMRRFSDLLSEDLWKLLAP